MFGAKQMTMKHAVFFSCLLAFSLTACGAPSDNAKNAVRQSASEEGARKLTWEELVPEGEEARLVELYKKQAAERGPIEEGSAGDVAVQIGSFNTVAAFDGQRVRLPGYTVPFEYGTNAKINEFLLVPYYGACLHAPPPPPNQTIYVTTTSEIQLADLAQAVWIEGTIRTVTQSTALADAAYTFELDKIETY